MIAFSEEFKKIFAATNVLSSKREFLEKIEEAVWWTTANIKEMEMKRPLEPVSELETIEESYKKGIEQNNAFAQTDAIVRYIN